MCSELEEEGDMKWKLLERLQFNSRFMEEQYPCKRLSPFLATHRIPVFPCVLRIFFYSMSKMFISGCLCDTEHRVCLHSHTES